MLNISLEIHDANKDAERRARAVVAMLYDIFGDAVLPGEGRRFSPVTKEEISSPKVQIEEKASDGYPEDTAEPDAAAAFGTPPVMPDRVDTLARVPSNHMAERDKDGIPWDERIHASTKTTNKDGTWTRRRNTPDDVFDKVMAELKAANTTRTMEAAAGLVPTPSAPAVAPSVPLPPTPAVPAPPTASPAPSPAPAAPAASSTAPAVDFPSVMVKITKAQSTGKITAEEINNLLLSVGATGGVIALNKNPSLIPAFDALLEDHLASAA